MAVRPLPVSLVIPVRDEEASLPALIAALRAQTHKPAEILIVDGGSADATVALVRRLTVGDPRFRLIEVADGSPGRNRNAGAEAARGDWLAFTDAGAWPEPDWLERLVERVTPGVDIVYGNYEPVEDGFFTRAAALAYPPPKVLRDGGRMRGPSTVSLLLARSAWLKVGGFPDLRAAEDLVFIERLAAGGSTIAWAPRATVHWQLPPTLGATFRRFALFSRHNAEAGRQWHWHHGTARHYALVALLALLALLHSPWWLPGIPAWLAARTGRAIWRRRAGRGLLWVLNPTRVPPVALILLTIDAATFIGWARAAAPFSGGRRRARDRRRRSA